MYRLSDVCAWIKTKRQLITPTTFWCPPKTRDTFFLFVSWRAAAFQADEWRRSEPVVQTASSFQNVSGTRVKLSLLVTAEEKADSAWKMLPLHCDGGINCPQLAKLRVSWTLKGLKKLGASGKNGEIKREQQISSDQIDVSRGEERSSSTYNQQRCCVCVYSVWGERWGATTYTPTCSAFLEGPLQSQGRGRYGCEPLAARHRSAISVLALYSKTQSKAPLGPGPVLQKHKKHQTLPFFSCGKKRRKEKRRKKRLQWTRLHWGLSAALVRSGRRWHASRSDKIKNKKFVITNFSLFWTWMW